MKIAGFIFTLALFAFMNLFSCTEEQESDSQEQEQLLEQEEQAQEQVEYITISGSNFGDVGGLHLSNKSVCIDGEVYYCEDGELKSLTDGEVIWAPDEFELYNAYYDDGKLYGYGNQYVYVHTLSTGETRMIPEAFFDLPHRLIEADGRIYISGWYTSEVGSYDETDGSYVAYDIVGHSELAWCDGSLYVYAGDGIHVFDDTVKSGEVNEIGSPLVKGRKLDITPPDGINFSGKVSDIGKLYIASDGSIIFTIGDNILRYDGKDCKRLDVNCTEENLLYVYKSRLYYLDGESNLYSYDYLTGDVALVYEDIPGMLSLVGDRIIYSNIDGTFELVRLE